MLTFSFHSTFPQPEEIHALLGNEPELAVKTLNHSTSPALTKTSPNSHSAYTQNGHGVEAANTAPLCPLRPCEHLPNELQENNLWMYQKLQESGSFANPSIREQLVCQN